MQRQRISTWLIRALAGVALLSWSGTIVSTRPAPRPDVTYRGVLTAVHFDISAPLSELAKMAPEPGVGHMARENPDPPAGGDVPLGPQDVDERVQTEVGSGEISAPIVNFDTLDNPTGITPLDPVGDVGPSHYVAMNVQRFAVFDKAGALVAGPALNNTLWAGFGGDCETENFGEPIVLHDQLSDRWLLTRATRLGPTFFICVALSTGPNPAGTYYRWAFSTGSNLPDDLKFAVWPAQDAFFASTREVTGPGGTFAGVGAYAFHLSEMLGGNPDPTVVSFLAAPGAAPWTLGDGLLPADIDGFIPAPAASPGLFFGSQDNGGPFPGTPSDAINVWKFNPNFITPGLSTFALTHTLPVAPFDSMFPCSPAIRDCIPQPGTTQKLDHQGYRQRLLHRAAYRNLGTHEAIVLNQSVEAAGMVSGIRWYELRNLTSPVVFQQGTYAPRTTDNLHRWSGSIAMDRAGNIALGYSVSHASVVYPGIRYTGRQPGDVLGTLPQGEGTIAVGAGSLTLSAGWGEYTSMNVDPADDCTFWYTNQYLPTNGSAAAVRMRAGSFKLPNCPASPRGYQRFSNNTPIVNFTDNESSITVSGIAGNVSQVRVSLHILHAYDPDVEISLIGPDGTTVDLSSANGVSGLNSANYGTACSPLSVRTTFDDDAATSIVGSAAPFIGSFRPEVPLSAYNGKSGANVNGLWKLRVVDNFPLEDAGTLVCWSLEIDAGFENTTPLPIPDVSTVESTLAVAGVVGALNQVRVSFHITHTFQGDLDISLIAPDGTTINLTSDNGSSNDNYGSGCTPQSSRTTFADTGPISVAPGTPTMAGLLRPEQPLRTLRGLGGANLNGTWTLRITDDAAQDVGTLQCWSLFIDSSDQRNFDMEGDGRSEVGIYRPSTGGWFALKSSSGFATFDAFAWGTATDIPVPGDYDGDGRSDIAIYRPSTGVWLVLKSTTNYTTSTSHTWGSATDVAMPGDYDGDHISDVAIYRPSTGAWLVLKSSSNFTTFTAYSWGGGTDVPVPGDYDGDGITDVTIYRPSTGAWFVLQSSSNFTTFTSHSWGAPSDLAIRGDFDGDGRTDITVYRPSTATWFVLTSTSNFTTFISFIWGGGTDVPVAGDYDGDGITDITVFRPSTGEWLVLLSISNFTTSATFTWGTSGDIALPRQ